MPITVPCSCGKKLRAPDSLAGLKARCPGCGKVLDVPGQANRPLQDDEPVVITPVAKSPAAPIAKPAAPKPASPAAAPPPARAQATPIAAPVHRSHENTPQTHAKSAEIQPEEIKPVESHPSIAQQKPQVVEASNVDDPYELAIELVAAPETKPQDRKAAQLSNGEITLPQSSDDPDKITGKKCQGCGAPMSLEETRCPRCSFDPTKGTYKDFLRDRQLRTGRYKNTEETKTYGNIMGIDLTPGKMITMLLCFLVVVGVIVWWFTGPGRNFILVSSEPVLAIFPLPAVEDRSNAATPSILAPGTIVPNKVASKGGTPPPLELSLGGQDGLVLTQPDDAGGHLLVTLEVSQRLLEEEKLEEHYDLLVHGMNFSIEGPGGPLPGSILATKLTNGLSINIANSKTGDAKSLWPAGYKPTFHESNRGVGLATWDGTNGLKGELKYHNLAEMGRGDYVSTGFTAQGNLQLLDRKTQVDYRYTGGMLTLTWNQTQFAYHITEQQRIQPDISPYHKYLFQVLFARVPAGTPGAENGDYRIKIGGRIVGKLVPSDVVAPPKSNGSTGPTSYKSGDPITQYLSALSVAKSRATGVISMNNLQQLAEGVLIYAQSNGGKMPATVRDLEQSMGGFQALMTNPRTKENPGFLYVCPAPTFNQITRPEKTVIIYELFEGKPDPNGQVAYADGHVGSYPASGN